METIYKAIEDKIKAAGYPYPVSGEAIYDCICDEIADKEPGTYLFMSKETDDTFFEYKIDLYEENLNLSYIDIHTPNGKIHVDFDH
jgi:hypothetical protein